MSKLTLDLKIKHFVNFLIENSFWFNENYNIKFDTYFKTGGIVKVFCTPNKKIDLINILSYLNDNNMEYKIIGFTSNILLFDHVSYSVIISTKNLTNLNKIDDEVEVDCGYSLQDFTRVMSILYNSSGYEGLEGIPGSIGGGIFMNAAAYGTAISDLISTVTFINSNGQVETKNNTDCHFTYRQSFFKHNPQNIIISAKFKIKKGNYKIIQEKIETYHIARHSYQEFVYPNLGSLISINKDIYYSLLKNNFYYKYYYYFLKIIYKNPFIKLLKRKKPDNIVFNNLIQSHLGLFPIEPSKKSINILLNRGGYEIKEIYKYVINLHDKLDGSISIENEFVFDPIYKIDKEFEELHFKMKTKLTKLKQ